MEKLARRSFLTGAALLVASPAIVRASSLMPIKSYLSEADLYFADVEKFQHILIAKMEENLLDAIQSAGPIRYDDTGFQKVVLAVSGMVIGQITVIGP